MQEIKISEEYQITYSYYVPKYQKQLYQNQTKRNQPYPYRMSTKSMRTKNEEANRFVRTGGIVTTEYT